MSTKRQPAKRPLSCHLCTRPVDPVRVSRGQHRAKVNGVERTYVDVTCVCGNEWQSVDARALTIAKKADAAAKATAGPQT